jgi:undecaprenyl-phosphate 4-deoxy-4-formamido-L-arabinose transferase
MNTTAPSSPKVCADIEFSVLITCYYEENSIDEFHRRLSATLESLNRSYEIIFVNDGSRDGTWEKLKAIFAKDPHVYAVIDLFKNSGQQAAETAALNESSGRALIFIDSDLQLAPEELPALVAEYDRGCDLVTGYRKNRKDSLFRILPSMLANVIMRKASHSKIRDFGCTFKIFNAVPVRAFQFGPRHLISFVEVISKIDRIAEIPVTHFRRRYGSSGWTFAKLLKYNMDNMVILSERPFQATALLCAAAVLLLVLRVLLYRFYPHMILSSVSNGLLLNAILAALLVNVALLSIIGEFAIRSFFAHRGLPLYIVREKLSRARGTELESFKNSALSS